jgi:transposase
MVTPEKQGELFAAAVVSAAPDTIAINARATLRTRDGYRAVLVAGMPVAHFSEGDRMAEAHAMVMLVEQGWADQREVAIAFACSARTVRRAQRRFETGGLAALGRSAGYPKGRARVRPTRARRVNDLKAQGLSNHAIAERLGVTEKAVRKLLRRLGWKASEPEQTELPVGGGADPNLSASSIAAPASAPAASEQAAGEATAAAATQSEPPSAGADPNLSACPSAVPAFAPAAPTQAAGEAAAATATQSEPPSAGADPNLSACPSDAADEPLPVSFDTDPADRRIDRLFAYMGLLDDAAPMFRAGARIPRAGVLLAMPALLHTGVLDAARDVYGGLGPAFYGLRTSLVTMLLMGLLRIKRPEGLKEHAPDDLGRLLGLDRAPEVKTLRRKLARLASAGRATDFGRALAERRVAARGAALGFLYVDGHVRVYHGKHTLPKAHVTQMRIALPATTDYWVNDVAGEPLFVVTAEANAGMVKMLPGLLDEVRRLIGERRVTIVFDRGGWSPRLFQQILAAGFDILTYRKGRSRRVPSTRFHEREAILDGRKVRYVLADQRISLLKGKLRLRQVTRLSDDGQHQTAIITSRFDLSDIEVAFRMFERWRQENFFKYLGEEYALDALVDYQVEPADPTRDVPNPRWNALDAELRAARAHVARLAALYGFEALGNKESLRRTMRGFKIAHASQNREIVAALERLAALDAKRSAVPRRVPVQNVVEGQVIKLAVERKHLTNLLKMVAYQAESDLVRVVTPHYKRADDEGRTLIQAALASAADLDVTDTELRLTLAPQSSPHRTRAIAALCDDLNRTPTRFPGTRLTLRFAIHQPAAADPSG